MSTDRYQSPLSERYASKEMQYIFSPDMKFRTWSCLLYTSWPVSVLFVLLFGMPELSASLRGFCGGTLYVAFCLVYAVMNVPFSTLMSLMTADAGERVQFNKYKCLGSNIGGVFVTGTTMLFVTHLAGNQRQGFLRTAMLFAVLFTVFMLICFFNTKILK